VDIYDGLSGYFDDIVEFEGRKARMEVTLLELPPVLQIQLQVCFNIFFKHFQALIAWQRVQFNRDTLQPYKSQAYVKFWENLYMDRFLDTADPIKKNKSKAIQSELSACRDRVRQLVEGKVGGLSRVRVQGTNLSFRILPSHLPLSIRGAS
jgi:ubiquitin carboxyl-terminal hydrolase 25/28